MSDAKVNAKREKAKAIIRGASGEPVTSKVDYKLSLIKALNWYNANEDYKVIRKFAETYVKDYHKTCMRAVEEATDSEIRYIGLFGRLIERGQYVSDEHVTYINKQLSAIKAKYDRQATPAVESTKVRVSIQDRISDAALKYTGDIDNAIDEYVQSKNSEFTAKSYILSKSISGAVAKRLGEIYKPLARELNEACSGKDEQLVEGYSFFTKAQLKKFLAFVQSIINDCEQQKVVRAPRTKKVKPPSVIAAKVQYMKEFAELGLKSVKPENIVGASELWVYIPAKRKLSVFRGADGQSLTVRGTSLVNYDTIESETKTLRKPEEFFKKLTSTGKRAMATAWKSLSTKAAKARGRLSEEMILLAVN